MLVLDGFTRREFDEAPPWQAGLRFGYRPFAINQSS